MKCSLLVAVALLGAALCSASPVPAGSDSGVQLVQIPLADNKVSIISYVDAHSTTLRTALKRRIQRRKY